MPRLKQPSPEVKGTRTHPRYGRQKEGRGRPPRSTLAPPNSTTRFGPAMSWAQLTRFPVRSMLPSARRNSGSLGGHPAGLDQRNVAFSAARTSPSWASSRTRAYRPCTPKQ